MQDVNISQPFLPPTVVIKTSTENKTFFKEKNEEAFLYWLKYLHGHKMVIQNVSKQYFCLRERLFIPSVKT